MRQVEIQAYSVEEAVRLALEQLGRTRDQVKVEVLATDPGSEEVLVRVTAQESRGSVSEEETSPRRSNRAGFPSLLGQSTPPRTADRRPTGNIDRGRDEQRGNRIDRGPRGDRPPGNRSGTGAGRNERDRGGQRWDRGPRGYQSRDRDNRGLPREDAFEEVDTSNRPEVAVDLDESLLPKSADAGEHATPEDAIAPLAGEILQKILMGMRIRARIVRRGAEEEGEAAFPDDQDCVTLNVLGLSERDQNALIGRRGETLESLQFLVNLVVGRQVDLWTRVIVDVEGYRLRRKFALINLARRTADQVETRKQAVPLEAMPAFERRIIHMTLADHPNVTTESTGVEPERRVIVLPK